MIRLHLIKIGLISGAVVLFGAGAALAADASVDTTGPSSQNVVSITETTTVSTMNHNNISVTNTNDQTSSTGSANVSGNTDGGSAISGDASSSATTTTTVTVGNAGAAGGSGGGTGGGTLPEGGNSGSGGTGGGTIPSTGGSGGGGMGGGSLQTLPNTGPAFPIDVSALRALWHPISSTTPTQNAVTQTKGVSTGLLIAAGLLTLMGAAGSVTFAAKRAAKV